MPVNPGKFGIRQERSWSSVTLSRFESPGSIPPLLHLGSSTTPPK